MTAIRSGRPDDFGDVDVSMGIQTNIMRRKEISGSCWI